MKPIEIAPGMENSQQSLRGYAKQYEETLRKRIERSLSGVWAILQIEIMRGSESMVEVSPVGALVYAHVLQVCVDFLGKNPHPVRFATLHERVSKHLSDADDNLTVMRAWAELGHVEIFTTDEDLVLAEGHRSIRSSLETIAQFCPDTS